MVKSLCSNWSVVTSCQIWGTSLSITFLISKIKMMIMLQPLHRVVAGSMQAAQA